LRLVWSCLAVLRCGGDVGAFDSSIIVAKSLITRFGQTVTLQTFASVAGANPWDAPTITKTEQSIEAVFLDYEQKYIDGTLIQAGDQRVFMPASGLNTYPQRESIISRGGDLWKVVNVSPLNPNGQNIMFELQVRK